MKNCEKCGDEIKSGKLCYACRSYLKRGGVWHPLPEIGKVECDSAGNVICHVCGMSYEKLIEHTKRKHGLDSQAYRQNFGLPYSAQLIGPNYKSKMQSYVAKNPTYIKNFVVKENLAEDISVKEDLAEGIENMEVQKETQVKTNLSEARHIRCVKNGSQSKKNLSGLQLLMLGKVWAKNIGMSAR